MQMMTAMYSYNLNGAMVRPEAKLQTNRYFFHIIMADKKGEAMCMHIPLTCTLLTAIGSLSHLKKLMCTYKCIGCAYNICSTKWVGVLTSIL